MKTREILTSTETDFALQLKSMSAKECERHARKLVHKLKGPTYEKLLMDICRELIPSANDKSILRFYNVVLKNYPGWDKTDDRLGRLTSLILMVLDKRTNGFKDLASLMKPLH